jgi:hypothetical protein
MVFHIGAGMVEYAHLVDVNLTVILLTNNQGFNPYGLTNEFIRFSLPEAQKSKN